MRFNLHSIFHIGRGRTVIQDIMNLDRIGKYIRKFFEKDSDARPLSIARVLVTEA